MSYFVNTGRPAALTINGTSYLNNLISWVASDSSAFKNGIISTTGTLVLGKVQGGYGVSDYDRNNFRRGMPIILTITYPDGTTSRHPRGLLYVVSTSYDVENEQLSVEMGCRLALAALTDDTTALETLAPIYLDPAQRRFSNISASFATAGQYIYQDNMGDFQVGSFFSGDGLGTVAASSWTSILGGTALSARPLAGAQAIPDQVEITFQVPASSVAVDESGKVDIVETSSYYYTVYPATIYVRSGDGTLPSGVTEDPVYASTGGIGRVSGCGNTPAEPAGNGLPTCSAGYQTEATDLIIPAFRRETQTTEYKGPAGQVSRIFTEVRGPAIEANRQYYADSFAYCRAVWATACQPNGACPVDGTDEILLGYTEQLNYYGSANELIRTITDEYATRLSAAKPTDWRSGINNGVPQDFTTINVGDLYRASRVDVQYYDEGAWRVQDTITHTSISSNGSGLAGDLDALAGVTTRQTRKSTTIGVAPVQPDTANSATTNTVEEVEKAILFADGYTEPPAEAGPYVIKESALTPLLDNDEAVREGMKAVYSDYLTRFIKGDALGMEIAEGLRKDIATSWHPGTPFRYVDNGNTTVLALRMDATTWGVSLDGSVVGMNGIWVGTATGTGSTGRNLVGDSTPGMGGSVVPPAATSAITVTTTTPFGSGALAFNIDVDLKFKSTIDLVSDQVTVFLASTDTVSQHGTFMCYVSGLKIAAGGLLTIGANGSIPLSYAGSVVSSSATVQDYDLFS